MLTMQCFLLYLTESQESYREVFHGRDWVLGLVVRARAVECLPFYFLEVASNPLPEQVKAVTVATSLVYEAGTSSVIPYNASPVNDFYESQPIDSIDSKNVYYEMDQRVRFEKKFLNIEEHVRRKDEEIVNFKTRLERLEGDSIKFVRLYGRVSDLDSTDTGRVEELASIGAKNTELIRQVSVLKALRDDLKNQMKGEDQMRKDFKAVQDAQA
ncbi:hypothetical protein Tco_0064713 [Tanacetum coccineum]